MSKRIIEPTARERVCLERGWHRVRHVDEYGCDYEAVCLDCGNVGDLQWAMPNLFKEFFPPNGRSI